MFTFVQINGAVNVFCRLLPPVFIIKSHIKNYRVKGFSEEIISTSAYSSSNRARHAVHLVGGMHILSQSIDENLS